MKEASEIVELPVSGVENEDNARIVEKELGKIKGVTGKRMEFNNHRAIIEASSRDSVLQAIHAIRDIGYKVDTVKQEFPVSGMSCASCAINVQNKLNEEPGVLAASVNYANGKAVVEYIPTMAQPSHFKSSIQSIGYDLMVASGKDQEDQWEKNQASAYQKVKNRTFWSIGLTIPLVILAMGFPDWKPGLWLMWALSTLVVFSFGRQFFVNAWKLARHGSANMDTLVALSTGIAYLFSFFNSLFPEFWTQRGLVGHVYFEAAAVVITFILLGKMLEEKAKAQISFAIKKLMGLQPAEVDVLDTGGKTQRKKIAEVSVGDQILVRPGDKIAVDGKVRSGNSYVDESMITGEPVAVYKEKDSLVYGGTLNQKGSLVFEATKVGSETLLAQIIKMVREAQGSKAPVQKLVDRIAGIFVPSVMGISIAVFLIWMIFGGAQGFSHGLLAMVTVLVIACPCALGLATPTALMAGMGKGAQQGILIKDATSLETAKKIQAVVLDKTGTLTAGHPQVVHSQWSSPEDETQFAAVLLSAESNSGHPLAAPLVENLSSRSLDT
ncbi:MAG: heavy metal translocating P-type ATPase, partial [Bacteroidota bacterium]|nr:heavy metal translocating P-type ATPase [Bacteroidota bacterium]